TDSLNVIDPSTPARRVSNLRYREDAQRLGTAASAAMIDRRTGRFTALMPAVPLIPGKGQGNTLTWAKVPVNATAKGAAVGQAFRAWLLANHDALNIDPKELVEQARVSPVAEDYYHIYQPRQIDGVPVRDSAIAATVKHGNLILLGTIDWGDVERQT